LAQALLAPQALPELLAGSTSVEELADCLAESWRKNPAMAAAKVEAGLAMAATEARVREQSKLETKIAECEKAGDYLQASELRSLNHHIPQTRVKLILLIDQLEEIFAIADVTAHEHEEFAAVIDSLARSGFVWTIATLQFSRAAPRPGPTDGRWRRISIASPNVRRIGPDDQASCIVCRFAVRGAFEDPHHT
jgi:hypothetical protein